MKEYPWYTPYQFAGNKPIAFIDREGLEEARFEEKVWAAINLFDALQVRNNMQTAVNAAQNSGLPHARDGQQDAFRHAYWNALNARDIDAGDAEPFATLHEMGSNPAFNPDNSSTPINHPNTYDPIAIDMDLHNNEIGRQIGENNVDATNEELEQLVMDALRKGELRIIKMNGNGECLDINNQVVDDNREKVIISSDGSKNNPLNAKTRESYDRQNTYTHELPEPSMQERE